MGMWIRGAGYASRATVVAGIFYSFKDEYDRLKLAYVSGFLAKSNPGMQRSRKETTIAFSRRTPIAKRKSMGVRLTQDFSAGGEFICLASEQMVRIEFVSRTHALGK